MKPTGRNTAMMALVVATTARPIWSAPSIAASNGRMPVKTRFSMFSISTMASSTRMPITRVKPSSVMVLRLKPARFMKAKVGISDTGMATAVTAVARQSRRNSHTTRAAKAMPSSRVCRVAEKASRV